MGQFVFSLSLSLLKYIYIWMTITYVWFEEGVLKQFYAAIFAIAFNTFWNVFFGPNMFDAWFERGCLMNISFWTQKQEWKL